MTQEVQPYESGSWWGTFFRIWLPTISVMILTTIALYVFSVEPPPPKTIVIATGSKAGAYYKLGLKYKEVLRKEGINLKILNTAGSVSNLTQLSAPNSKIHLAFVQGGITTPHNPNQKTNHLRSLGSLYSEAMWVFYRSKEPMEQLTQLKGKRIGVGPNGSGTRPVTLAVLRENGITEKNASFHRLSSLETMSQLQAGKLDAAFFITSPKASYVQKLLKDPNIRLMNFKRFRSYTYKFSFLSALELGAGQLNLARNVPAHTIHMLAPAATLVIRDDFPSSLIFLVMRALQKVHAPGNLLDSPGKFPSKKFVSFPMHPQAKQYLRYGPTWLQRNLPFWWATFLQRFSILGFSLLTLLYPLFKTAPMFYTWRVRHRIFRWYRVLRGIDHKLLSSTPAEELQGYLPELDRLDRESREIKVPLWHMAELYTLRIHIHFLRTQINRVLDEESAKKS